MTTPVPTPPQPTPPAPQVPAPSPTTFSQDDVNRIVAERLARESKKFEGFDDLKAKAEKYDAIAAENATELEKAVAQAVESTRADAAKATNSTLVRAEVKALAAAAQFHDPAVAAPLLGDRLAGVPVDSSGQVDVDAAKALVDLLATEQPYLVKSATGSAPAPLPGQGTPPAAPNMGSVSAGADEYRRKKKTAT